MDEMNAVSYFKNQANELILMKCKSMAIEDEILDLDAISSNNEDTWLYSTGKVSLLDSTDSMDENNDTKSDHEELAKEFASCAFNIDKETVLHDSDYTISSADSQLLHSNDFQNCPFINSYDVLTNSALEGLLQTPANAKQKSDLLKKVLSSDSARSLTKSKTENTTPFDDATFKKPPLKDFILYSVENKQSKCVYRNPSNKVVDIQRSFGSSGDCTPSDAPCPVKNSGLTDEMAALTLSDHEDENNENTYTFPKRTPLIWHSTPHGSCSNEKGTMPTKKILPLCHPSPVLMSRYLKYNKTEEATTKWRLSNEFSNGDEKVDSGKNEMNVSYIKYENDNQCANLPCIDKDDDARSKGNLNSTFSKSEDMLAARVVEERLNSAYNNIVEDDLASSTSESSLSSVGNKHTLSIKEVQKMADLQERSLKNYNRSSYFAGSSKSSEVSSSSESISTFGALSSSNEGQINLINSKNVIPCRIMPQNTFLKNSRLSSPSSRNGMSNHRDSKLDTTPSRGARQLMTMINDRTFVAATSSKLSLSNANTNTKVLQNKKPPITKLSTTKPSISNANNEEIVSVKEIQSKDTIEVKTAGVKQIPITTNNGPVSHIPRPSSRIPMPRTSRSSASCTRLSKS